MTTIDITVQLPSGEEVHAGVLREEPSPTGGSPFISFNYSPDYLRASGSYALSPELHLDSGLQRPPVYRQMFLGFEDAGPDRWGRNLLQEEERILARRAGRPFGRLSALESLIRVSDDTRQGALRFWREGKPLGSSVLPDRADSVDWQQLLTAADDVEAGRNIEPALEVLFQFGSASPGGARPKIQVTDAENALWLAKLPAFGDRWDVSLWEEVTLRLAARAGIQVPEHRLQRTSTGRSILLVKRFDRDGTRRIGYRSARTLLQLDDHELERRSYSQLSREILRMSGPSDAHELFRRVAFTVLVSNLDDHMRNHGFLRSQSGWRLSPMFDVNPHRGSQFGSTPITPTGDPHFRTLRELVEAREEFELTHNDAVDIVREVELATRSWSEVAHDVGEDPETIENFSQLFEHEEREWARDLT